MPKTKARVLYPCYARSLQDKLRKGPGISKDGRIPAAFPPGFARSRNQEGFIPPPFQQHSAQSRNQKGVTPSPLPQDSAQSSNQEDVVIPAPLPPDSTQSRNQEDVVIPAPLPPDSTQSRNQDDVVIPAPLPSDSTQSRNQEDVFIATPSSRDSTQSGNEEDLVIPAPLSQDSAQSKNLHPIEGNIKEKVCQKSTIIPDSENCGALEANARGSSSNEEAQRDEIDEIRHANNVFDALTEKTCTLREVQESCEKNTDTGPCSYAGNVKSRVTNANNITGNQRSDDLNFILRPKPVRPLDSTGQDRHKESHEVGNPGSKVTLPCDYAGDERTTYGLHDGVEHFLVERKKVVEINLQRNLDHLSKNQKTRADPKSGDRVPKVIEQENLLQRDCIRTIADVMPQTTTNRFYEGEKRGDVHTITQNIDSPEATQSLCNEKQASNISRITGHRVLPTLQKDSSKQETEKKRPAKGKYLREDTSVFHLQSSVSVKHLPADVAQAESNIYQHRDLLAETDLASGTSAHVKPEKTPNANDIQRSKYENWKKNKESNEVKNEEALYLSHHNMPKGSPHKTTFFMREPAPQSYLETPQKRREGLKSSLHHPKSLRKSKEDPPLMKIILSDPVLWVELMHRPKLLQGLMQLPTAVQENLRETGIFQHLSTKPGIFHQLLGLPEIFQDLASQPFLFHELLNLPVLLEDSFLTTDTSGQLVQTPLLSLLLLNPNTLRHLMYQPEFFCTLLHRQEILHSLLQAPALLERLFTEPVIFLYRLLLEWPVLQQILQHPYIWM